MDAVKTGSILVTGARAPVALDCARAFAAAGCEVHLADSVTPWAARWSRLGAPVHRLPPPRHAFAVFSEALRTLVEQHDFSLIVPTCEEVFFVAAAAEADGYGARVFAPPFATLRTLHSKHDFASFAASLGLPAPRTVRIIDRDAIRRIDLAKTVLKPEFSRFSVSALVRPDDRQIARLRPSPAQPWVAQDLVVGEEISLWSAVWRGDVTLVAAYRLRRRLHRSAAYAFEAIRCPAAEAIARRIAAATGMTGHLSFDIIVTPDGEAVPIECNPRAVSGLHLLDADASLARAIQGAPQPSPSPGTRRHLGPAMALLGLPSALLAGDARSFVADWRAGRDVVGRPGDRLPAVGAVVDAARFALLGLSRRRSPSGQTTDDIEWNGEPIG